MAKQDIVVLAVPLLFYNDYKIPLWVQSMPSGRKTALTELSRQGVLYNKSYNVREKRSI